MFFHPSILDIVEIKDNIRDYHIEINSKNEIYGGTESRGIF